MRRFMLGLRRSAAFGAVFVCALAAGGALFTAAPARAQLVFEDNFNGSALAPHWVTPPASHWEYDVSGGMLNVHQLLFPSHPKSGLNDAGITAGFASGLSDFEARSRFGVLGGVDYRVLSFVVSGNTSNIAIVSYQVSPAQSLARFLLITPLVPTVEIPAPLFGTFDVAVQRAGTELRILIDGALMASVPSVMDAPTSLGLAFTRIFPSSGQSASMHVDFVRVVPGPSALCVLALAVACARRR